MVATAVPVKQTAMALHCFLLSQYYHRGILSMVLQRRFVTGIKMISIDIIIIMFATVYWLLLVRLNNNW